MGNGASAVTGCGFLLIGTIAFILAIVLTSRAPLRVVGRLLGSKRPSEKSSAFARIQDPQTGDAEDDDEPAAPIPSFNQIPSYRRQVRSSALLRIVRPFRSETGVDRALNGVDEGFDSEEDLAKGHYNYRTNEERKLSRLGVIFRWISVKPAYMPDISNLTSELAETYYRAAKRFFHCQVPIESDVANLYDDVEGGIIISLFRNRDRNCYYLLNEMRRIIDDNVRKLVFIFLSIIFAVLVTELFFFDRVQIRFFSIFGWQPDASILGIKVAHLDHGLSGIALCAFGAFLMWLLYYIEYVPNQRNNGRELRSFLSRYMSRLSDRYRDILANARAVTVGDETDSSKLSREAQKWNKIMLWLAFRAFFIESYVRNVLFQIGRNCGYYIVLVPLLYVLGFAAIFALCAQSSHVDIVALLSQPGLSFYLAFLALLALFVIFIFHAMNPIDDMNQADWLGFDNINVNKGMDDVVGKYAEDVGFWKGRLDR